MAQALVMPKFGQMVEESSIVKWRKKEGDFVKKGDIVFEIETDKAVMEVESFFEGTLLKIVVPENVTVPVSSIVGYIGTQGEEIPKAEQPVPVKPVAQQQEKASQPKSDERQIKKAATEQNKAVAAGSVEMPVKSAGSNKTPVERRKLFISPRAKSLAKRACVNPDRIVGTGPGGRITEKDVKAYLDANGYDKIRISPAARRLAAKEAVDILHVRGTGLGGRIMLSDVERAIAERPRPLSKMRQVIAKRLTESFTGTPHFYVTVAADMTDLLAYRQMLKNQGISYTVTDFILEAVILSLVEYPVLNSVCEGTTIRWRGNVDLGIAVALDDGLVVPVIRGAQDLSLSELSETAKALAYKARAGKLTPDEMTGSSFTVSNMGMLNVDSFQAIINPGESAILAVASSKEQAVVRNGEIAVRNMMNMTLSVDHRIVDGSLAAEFINAIRKKLEDVELWKSLT